MNPLALAASQATKHAILRTISVICVIGICALIVLGIKRILYPPKSNITNQQGQGDNYNVGIEPRSYFGCQNFKIIRPDKPIDSLLPKKDRK